MPVFAINTCLDGLNSRPLVLLINHLLQLVVCLGNDYRGEHYPYPIEANEYEPEILELQITAERRGPLTILYTIR